MRFIDRAKRSGRPLRLSIFMSRQGEFESIVLPQVAGLARVARRLTLDGSVAEDLVQDTLMLAWRSFHQFQSGYLRQHNGFEFTLSSHEKETGRQHESRLPQL